ncbi:MAG: molybdenum cofactor biosynthesis protein C [Chloroflexi bacterium RBG_19FT_COMBO_48_23]|nr:MAG: molybdenum cofactor biosynthesis protein C [Chloroflexi bacterium RBG_19FT_COMBO_48_23]
MVDVGGKPVTKRQAVARGKVLMQAKTLGLLKKGKLPKGDVLAAARVAGIMAAKETYRLIPLCHPLLIDDAIIEFSIDEKASAVEITATVKGSGKTGFEMEALTAVAISGLTIYDMCKTVDGTLRLENIRLIKKSGGKSGTITLE